MKIFKKLLLVLIAAAGLAVLAGVGYFARERYATSGPVVVRNFIFGGKTADETMALLVSVLAKKDTEAAQRLFNEENQEGYASWATILQANKDNDLLDTMSKSVATAAKYGEATDKLARYAIINKLKTEGLVFSLAPNAKGLWQISDLARASLVKKK